MTTGNSSSERRIVYTDFLRVLSIFFVILLHAAATGKAEITPYSESWIVINTTISIARWAVPVFLMISGFFFLNPNKEISIGTIYKKYIKRIVIAFLFWSFLYAIATTNSAIRAGDPKAIGQILEKTIRGHAQYWYLLMLIGLYMVTPILKVFIRHANEKLICYFIILGFIFSSVIPLIASIRDCAIISETTAGLEVYLVCGYTVYYVLGYYLGNYEFNRKLRITFYFLGIIGAIITSFGYYISTEFLQASSDLFQDYLMFSNVFMSIAVFIWGKQWLENKQLRERTEKMIQLIAKYSFGMYLTNDFFNMCFYKCKISIFQFGVIPGILIFTMIDFIGSYILVSLLHKLPIFKRVC